MKRTLVYSKGAGTGRQSVTVFDLSEKNVVRRVKFFARS